MGSENRKRTVMPDISFITTVYNEEGNIIDFLKSLMEQTYLPNEIILVDGGSKDNTFKLTLKFFKHAAPLRYRDLKIILQGSDRGVVKIQRGQRPVINVRLIRKAGTNIAQGRNEAIKNASGSIICVSDAGCVLDRNWLKEITAFHSDGKCDVIGGLNLPLCRSFIQKCLSLCIMPAEKEVRAEGYMPSSRNISFKREIWSKIGGYPENMEYGEDMRFNFNIKAAGHKVKFNPKAVVYWRMRRNLVQIFKQFFRYAKGDALGGMYPFRHIIRFTALFTFLVILLAAFYFSKWILAALIPLFILYLFKPYVRLIRNRGASRNCSFKKFEKLLSIPVIPFLMLQIDFSKMCGYVYGAFHRI
jgi:glycosyltransferase involved in cell wall biosynthesis